MDTLTRGYSIALEDNLILKIAAEISEIEKIAAFNVLIHQEPLYDYMISLFTEDPLREESYWLYIEDSKSGEILSSLILLPNYWSIGGVEIKIAEMGFVGTLEEHRGKGLYRILNTFYEKLMKQEGLFLSVLRGIPYFYSKYGYGFSLPTDTGYCLNVENFEFTENKGEFEFRRAIDSDFGTIEKMYNEIFDHCLVYATFDREGFQYRYNSKQKRENFGITYVVLKNGKITGFFTLTSVSIDRPTQPDIFLISQMDISAIKEIIHFIVETFEVKDTICFNVSDDMITYKKLIELGVEPLSGWKWQVKITNLGWFINNILPILQKRLSESSFSSKTDNISISNYEEIVYLRIEKGELTIAKTVKQYPDHNITIRVPFNYFPMFVFGEKSYEEIKNIIPDIMIAPESRELSEILFPKSPSYPIYRY
ncbi:MAG: GNAT family N-acetyltransferase [Candidatus Heimdallarchaeota archaeon]|nr:GNAT family N-acetyltransferase [Candidatus Heimdallarchaeota archaeon]